MVLFGVVVVVMLGDLGAYWYGLCGVDGYVCLFAYWLVYALVLGLVVMVTFMVYGLGLLLWLNCLRGEFAGFVLVWLLVFCLRLFVLRLLVLVCRIDCYVCAGWLFIYVWLCG